MCNIFSEVHVRNSWDCWPSNVGQFCDHTISATHPLWGVVILYIGIATHTVITNSLLRYTIYSGNWFHNSCLTLLSHWICCNSSCDGVCERIMCVHQRHICASCMSCASWCEGGHGPDGGTWYMYTRIYTDQEKWSVNHITYIVVYTLGGCSFAGYTLHICSIYVSRIVTVCHIMLQYYD